MLFLAWHSARMEWTLACPGAGGFWHCHLACRFFLLQTPSAAWAVGLSFCFLRSSPSVGVLLTFAAVPFACVQPTASAQPPRSLAVADVPWLSWPWLGLSPFPASLCWSSCQVPGPLLSHQTSPRIALLPRHLWIPDQAKWLLLVLAEYFKDGFS